MTMIPAENLSKQHHLPQGSGGGGGGFYGFNCGRRYTESLGLHGYDYQNEACLGSDLVVATSMAEDDEGSSSNDNNNEERVKSWLQLGIGGQTQATRTYEQGDLASGRGGSTLTELDLLPGGGAQSQQARPLFPTFHIPEFRPPPRPTVINSFSNLFKPIAPASSSSLAPYFGRPFQVQPSSEVRIIDPPRRPHSGIWFMLQASGNQAKEPVLPQIPKNYLRIKDGKMTVKLIMKYLANKLRLDSESQIEMRCRGNKLEPLLTLQHVRDKIWSSTSGQALSLLQDYTSTPPNINHNNNNVIMVLHYGRS